MSRIKIADRWREVVEVDDNGCWIWTAARFQLGYGALRHHGKVVKAHRFVYEQIVGPVPDGLVLDHLCRVPSCVNPDHLEPVTQGENVRRSSVQLATLNASKKACPLGHAYTEENTYRWRGRRICRECGRRTSRTFQAQKRAKVSVR